MHLSRYVRLLPALLAFGLLVALPGGALAAAPTFHDKINDTFPDNICGVGGTSVVTGTQVGSSTSTSFKVSGQVNQIFTATDGRSVRLHVAGTSSSTFVDNLDGTATVTNTYKGLPEQIRGAKGGPTSRDAGMISFVTTFDLTTGDVISSSVISHGPHPEADSDFTIFCTAFFAALG